MMKDLRLVKPTLQAKFVEELLEGALSKGIDAGTVLEKAGVSPDILSNLNTRISIQIYYRILSAVREHMHDEMMGFLDKPVHPRAFPVFCEAATGYPDFESLIRFANDFYGLLTDEFRWNLQSNHESGTTMLSLGFKNGDEKYKRFIIEFLMVTTYRFGSWLIGGHYPVKSVHLTFSKPDNIERFQYLLAKRIFFDSDINGIVFDKGVLSRPITRTKKEVPSFLRSSIGWFLLNPEAFPYTRMIRQVISTNDISEGFPNFEQVAKRLNISHQHLWRKLNSEGTSYQQIKNQLRRDMAIHFLANSDMNINEIAYKVGYTAERPFYRMFFQWTGMSPGEYRQIFQT